MYPLTQSASAGLQKPLPRLWAAKPGHSFASRPWSMSREQSHSWGQAGYELRVFFALSSDQSSYLREYGEPASEVDVVRFS